MKTVVFAYHNIGCIGLEALLAAGFGIKAVFTHPDDPQESIFFRSVAELAAEKGLPVYSATDINNPVWVSRINEMAPDVLFSFYYRDLLPHSILSIPPVGAFNLHGSLLPRYRGRAPVNWAILHGETETGVTLHVMTKKPDDGDIVDQQAVAIGSADTAFDVHKKLEAASVQLLERQLPEIARKNVALTPQNPAEATYFGRRTAADGLIDWFKTAQSNHDLVRAVTRPYPGAFTCLGNDKLIIWSASVDSAQHDSDPGTVLSTNPLKIACQACSLVIEYGQVDNGLYMSAEQLVRDMNIIPGMFLGKSEAAKTQQRLKRVLILGVNGFIGNALTERLLAGGGYEVFGMDIHSDAITRFLSEDRFHFVEGDISIHTEWIEYHIKKCDIILPLVAIATPMSYVKEPLRVFELDFEQNLKIVRYCSKYEKRIIFPSTSEVYGMCTDEVFDEDSSTLIVGPISKQRWIYSTSKQLLDRVIWAYGVKEGLRFTLFRPFNWIGPRLDSLQSARVGSSRAITQLILNLVEGTPIKLVDGGEQKRAFTDLSDGVEALFLTIDDPLGMADGKIINIGNPDNELSIKNLAETLVERFEQHPLRSHFPPFAGYKFVESRDYYGEGYQDVQFRKPSIKNAKRYLGWEPTVEMKESIDICLDYFLQEEVNLQK